MKYDTFFDIIEMLFKRQGTGFQHWHKSSSRCQLGLMTRIGKNW